MHTQATQKVPVVLLDILDAICTTYSILPRILDFLIYAISQVLNVKRRLQRNFNYLQARQAPAGFSSEPLSQCERGSHRSPPARKGKPAPAPQALFLTFRDQLTLAGFNRHETLF